jgi:hypothetical protein
VREKKTFFGADDAFSTYSRGSREQGTAKITAKIENLIYSITARRMISGDVLKYLNGLGLVIKGG